MKKLVLIVVVALLGMTQSTTQSINNTYGKQTNLGSKPISQPAVQSTSTVLSSVTPDDSSDSTSHQNQPLVSPAPSTATNANAEATATDDLGTVSNPPTEPPVTTEPPQTVIVDPTPPQPYQPISGCGCGPRSPALPGHYMCNMMCAD